MATAVASHTVGKPAPGRRHDHRFFAFMCLVILATVFIGFAHTYYLAGVFRAPLASPILHVHGAVFTLWVLLFLTQTALVATHRIDIHRNLGLFGFALAGLMVVLGVLAAMNQLARNAAPPGYNAKQFFIVPLSDLFAFVPLVFLAYIARKNAPTHKRLILLATLALLDAGFARWPVPVENFMRFAEICTAATLLLVVAYDLFSLRTVHRATLWASAFIVFVQQLRHPIAYSAGWQHFAGWVQTLVR
jgi:hypothetical protein